MKEIWKDINDFEGKYLASTEGYIMSTNYNNTGKPKILKPKVNKQGYLEVTLNKNDKHFYRLVNRLIFETFTGVKLGRNDVVINKDGDKTNPALSNLELITRGKRQEISYDLGSRFVRKHEFYGEMMTIKELSKVKGVGRDVIERRIFEFGWGVEEAAEVPTAVYKRRMKDD